MRRKSVFFLLIISFILIVIDLLFFRKPPIPAFSEESGFYSEAFELELSAGLGNKIYYTLDGSDPDESSILYENSIKIENRDSTENIYSARDDFAATDYYIPEEPIPKCTIIKAVAVNILGQKGKSVTKTFFVSSDVVKNTELLTVSLTTDPDNLFDYHNGIYIKGENFSYNEADPVQSYANYRLRGNKSMREAVFEIFDENGQEILNTTIELKIHGKTTRGLPQKSFTIYFGDTSKADIFENNKPVEKLYLYNDRDETKIKRIINQFSLKDRNVCTQQFLYCNVFLDGEYWGIYSFAEAYDENYICNHYGIAPENVEFLDNAWPEDLINWLENEADLSKKEDWDAFCQKVDVDSLIDYYSSMLYINSSDWLPYNAKIWRSKTVGDAECEDNKWRWLIYDTELSDFFPQNNTFLTGIILTFDEDPLIQACKKNDTFRQKFINTLMDLMNNEMSAANMQTLTDLFADKLRPSIPYQCQRYGGTVQDFDANVDSVKAFFTERPDYIIEYAKENFSLSGTAENITIKTNDPTAGTVVVNSSVIDLTNGFWQGRYFTDFPVTVTATPCEGYRFVKWEGSASGSDNTVTVSVNRGLTLRACFEKQ